jgi:hypothetical protein
MLKEIPHHERIIKCAMTFLRAETVALDERGEIMSTLMRKERARELDGT